MIHTNNKSRVLNMGGFTLIEVVLVLAIGGLIFLLAFIAFQQVSTNRRDTQRRSDVRRVQAELENYKLNSTSQSYPQSPSTLTPEAQAFADSYLSNFKDPTTGQPYSITEGNSPEGLGEFMYKSPRVCNAAGTGTTGSGAEAHNYAIVWRFEKGGNVCFDNR